MRSGSGLLPGFWLFLSVVCGCSPAAELATPNGSALPTGPEDAGRDALVMRDAQSGAVRCSPTASSVQGDVFGPHCATAGCHRGASSAAALDLTRSDFASLLVSQSASSCDAQLLVVPGNPGASLLMSKITGHVPADCGDPMPPAGSLLAAEQIECVRGWIAGLSPVDGGMPTQDGGSPCQTCGGASCLDLASDERHCGTCDHACAPGASCLNGACKCPPAGCSCSGSDVLCTGACVDLSSDVDNCGRCGEVCGAGKTCIAGACSCAGAPVSFASIAPILAESCTNAGCHAGVSPKAGLNLTAAKAYAELVNVEASQCSDGRLLVPSTGSGPSYLLQKLYGEQLCSGTQMPKAGVSLSASALGLIEAWVCNGAAP